MGSEKKPFAVQAAQFSLYAPIVAIVLGCITFGTREKQPTAGLIIGGTNALIILLGFVFGIVALFGMRKHGKEGILVRAIIGVVLNGLFLLSFVAVALAIFRGTNIRPQVVGSWTMTKPAHGYNMDMNIDFADDGTFHWVTNFDTVPPRIAEIEGEWTLDKRAIGLTIRKVVAGDQNAVGTSIPLGVVKTVNDTELILLHKDGEDVMRRK